MLLLLLHPSTSELIHFGCALLWTSLVTSMCKNYITDTCTCLKFVKTVTVGSLKFPHVLSFMICVGLVVI